MNEDRTRVNPDYVKAPYRAVCVDLVTGKMTEITEDPTEDTFNPIQSVQCLDCGEPIAGISHRVCYQKAPSLIVLTGYLCDQCYQSTL